MSESIAVLDVIPAHYRERRNPTIAAIQAHVAKHYQINVDHMVGFCRRAPVNRPRQLAMYLSRKMCGASYPKIAVHFGNRNHTTIFHACRKIEGLFDTDPAFADEVQQLEASFSC